MGRLEQRAVLVTGATSGIGHATARRCAAESARVLAVRKVAGRHRTIDLTLSPGTVIYQYCAA